MRLMIDCCDKLPICPGPGLWVTAFLLQINPNLPRPVIDGNFIIKTMDICL